MSNQSTSIFTVFDRDGGTYRGAFKVGSAGAIDAVDQTDGVAITNLPLGPGFPSGMLDHAGRQGRAGGWHELQVHAVGDGGPGARADDRHERRPALIAAAAAAPLGPTMRTSLAGR